MPSFILRPASFSPGGRLAALWFGLLAGPLVWLALLQTNYVLSYVACEQRQTWMLHTAAALALASVGAAAVLARLAAPPLRPDGAENAGPPDPALLRARFMAHGALVLCAWFALVIVATEIPVWVLEPCTP